MATAPRRRPRRLLRSGLAYPRLRCLRLLGFGFGPQPDENPSCVSNCVTADIGPCGTGCPDLAGGLTSRRLAAEPEPT